MGARYQVSYVHDLNMMVRKLAQEHFQNVVISIRERPALDEGDLIGWHIEVWPRPSAAAPLQSGPDEWEMQRYVRLGTQHQESRQWENSHGIHPRTVG